MESNVLHRCSTTSLHHSDEPRKPKKASPGVIWRILPGPPYPNTMTDRHRFLIGCRLGALLPAAFLFAPRPLILVATADSASGQHAMLPANAYKGVDAAVNLLGRVCCGELDADARLALWNDGVREADDVNALG